MFKYACVTKNLFALVKPTVKWLRIPKDTTVFFFQSKAIEDEGQEDKYLWKGALVYQLSTKVSIAYGATVL